MNLVAANGEPIYGATTLRPGQAHNELELKSFKLILYMNLVEIHKNFKQLHWLGITSVGYQLNQWLYIDSMALLLF